MKLLNVRLDGADTRRVSELRRAGVAISTLVREAIRKEHEHRIGKRSGRRTARVVMASIYADHPDPPGVPRRRFDPRDRNAVRRTVAARVRRRRP